MKIIVAADGQEIQVSDEDYDYLIQFNWSSNSHGSFDRRVNRKLSKMHHEIALRMGWKFTLIDHKDQNPSNNQRNNLRVATKSQNGMNRPAQRNNIYSDYKGVTYDRKKHRWRYQIKAGSFIHNGLAASEKDAALAYNAWALRLHGEFAFLNDVE
jgi:hypothetical protein